MRIWKEIYELTKMAMDMGDSMEDITESFWKDLGFNHDEYAEDILTEEKLFELAYDHYEAEENYKPVLYSIEWFRDCIETIIFNNFLEDSDKATCYIKGLWAYCLKHKLPTDFIIEMFDCMPNNYDESKFDFQVCHEYWKYLDEDPVTNSAGNVGHYDIEKECYRAYPMNLVVSLHYKDVTITNGDTTEHFTLYDDVTESAKYLAYRVNNFKEENTMREIPYFNHTEGLYLTRHYCMNTDLKGLIKDWKSQVRQDCIDKNADHYVFQTTTYNKETNNIIEVNLYALPLNDEEFHKRIKAAQLMAENKGTVLYFGVWHKGTSY